MPRARLIETKVFPYHLCARSNNKDWFYLPTQEAWGILTDLLNVVVLKYQIRLHAVVLMSNHFHAIASTPQYSLGDPMLYLMREFSREVNRRTGRINHVFGGPYKWSLIDHRRYYEHVLKYVLRNPVDAGICRRVEEYKYSSIHSVLRAPDAELPIADSIFERRSVMDLKLSVNLAWLNQAYALEERECVRRALKRARFKLRNTNLRASLSRRLANPPKR